MDIFSFKELQLIGGLIAFVAIAISLIVNAISARLFSFKVGGLEIEIARDFKPTDNLENDSRLNEARELLRVQESSAKWNSRTTGSLQFGQYIIGGVLATSFVQESLKVQVVGFLGVLVLISSLVHQTYRPDIQARGARERVMRLRRLIRQAEDGLFAIKSNSVGAPTIQAVREMVSRGLSEIEGTELEDNPATSEQRR